MVDRLERLTEGSERPLHERHRDNRLIAVPLGFGELLSSRWIWSFSVGESTERGQDSQTIALAFVFAPGSRWRRSETLPRGHAAVVQHDLGAIGVVKREDGGLRDASVAPRLAGWTGLPSILIGRPV